MTIIGYPYGVDGITLRVLESGAGDGVVLFLHGLGARADRWRKNMESFADAGLHAYAIDFPGHGFSAKGVGPTYSVPGYAELVRRLLDQIGAGGQACLVGTSLGGHVAAKVALADPNALRGVVLVGPVGMRPLGEAARSAIAASVVDTSIDGIRAKLRKVLYREELLTEEWVREEHAINTSPGAAEALAAIARYFAEDVDDDVLDEDALRALAAAVPTRLIWGTADEVVPLGIADELETITGLTVARIPDAGHAPYFENPAEFDRAVLAFLQENQARRAPLDRLSAGRSERAR
jgi:pimeloyl-ACP methyl ester carboxylesterase